MDAVKKTEQLAMDLTAATRTIVFIDAAVADRESLLLGIHGNPDVVLLDANRDGLTQIDEVVKRHLDIASLHIISHGAPGCLLLGSCSISLNNLYTYRNILSGWRNSLLSGADILLYGCEVAAGDEGETFIQRISELTGANVAASANKRGNAAQGGDWILEKQIGIIETAIVISPQVQSNYQHLLATLCGTPGDDYLIGTDNDDHLVGYQGNDSMYGGLGNEIFLVNFDLAPYDPYGEDIFDGGLGNDIFEINCYGLLTLGKETLEGGDGNDIISISGNGTTDFSQATIINVEELQVNGYCSVKLTYEQYQAIETITGVDAYDGMHKNSITLSTAGTIDLGANKTPGIELFYGSAYNDTLLGSNDSDTLSGGEGDDYLTGGNGNDTLSGGNGNNTIDGGLGDDLLAGGTGDDLFIVDSAGDRVSGNTGTDLIISSVTYTLPDYTENLTLTGDSVIDGTGNSLANYIIGNAKDNVLDGRAGIDTLEGGVGNDTYMVDDSKDVVIEQANQGIEFVISNANFTLSDNIENLTLVGNASIKGVGNALNNTLIGNTASNILDGGVGADTMAGGLGYDTYVVDNAGDVVKELANEGTDLVQSSVSFVLDDNIEKLTLTGESDIDGVGNILNNTITGNAGNNVLDGGAGADTMEGGAGNDTYVVDDAGDFVIERQQNEGTDLVTSSVSFNLLGNYYCYNIENLILTGDSDINGSGNMYDNTIIGNAGANILNGGAGNDNISGGAGNDTINGGTGVDTMSGGTGDDTYLVDDVNDVITELAKEGADIVQSSSSTFTLSNNIETLILTGNYAVTGIGNILNNTITGNTNDNVLDGGAGADTMAGGTGNDTYLVDDAGDIVTEQASQGYYDLVQSSVTFTLGDNIEQLTLTGNSAINGTGNSLNNIITGNAGVNILKGDAGSDTLDGGAGADIMEGGIGNDTYLVDNEGDVVNELVNEGTDLVQSSVTFTIGNDIEKLTLTGSSAINGTGNILANTITGNAADNVLDGGAGIDTMIGGGGNDTYVVDNVSDVVTELASDMDTDLIQSSVSFTLVGNVENLLLTGNSAINGIGNTLDNVITGNSGDNILSGANGNDTIYGGDGNDTLIGANGADNLQGGNGNDTFSYTYAGYINSLAESIDGGAGMDIISLSSYSFILSSSVISNVEQILFTGAAGVSLTFAQYQTITSFMGSTSINRLTIDTQGTIDLTAKTLTSIEEFYGSAYNDTIIGTINSETIAGQEGNDSLSGGYGNDTIYGGDGNDTIYGGAGNDTLNGGAGVDNLQGDEGDDTFVYSSPSDISLSESVYGGSGVDTIYLVGSYGYDFSQAMINSIEQVKLEYSSNITLTNAQYQTLVALTGTLLGYGYINRLTVTTAGVIDVGTKLTGIEEIYGSADNDIIIGSANSETLAGQAGDDSLSGGAGNDNIIGGAGNDTMLGGMGNDTYVVDNVSDVITELTNEGTDTVNSSVTFTLGNNLENLTLTDSSAINGTGNTLANVIIGNAEANVLMGMDGDDSIIGGAGDDILDGGVGIDTMIGGTGNDTYLIDNVGDVFTELENGGVDLVKINRDYTLGANFENLTLMGSAISGTGNDFANIITGNTENNVLSGLDGNDTLIAGAGIDTLAGGLGDDTYVIDKDDIVNELADQGTDTIQSSFDYILANGVNVENLTLIGSAIKGTGNSLANNITGNDLANMLSGLDGNDTLNGGAGNDTLSGGTGADSMIGGLGNDTYEVDNAGDVATEALNVNEGTDTVKSSVDYTLGSYIENLILTGSAINGTGNNLANAITGNTANNVLTGLEGNDTLDGGAGADTLIGGVGNDTYLVDNLGDIIVEQENEGTDLVKNSRDYTLGENLENLTLTGSAAINGTGNSLDNAITGNIANNVLTGLGGNDTLDGGAGADTLIGGVGNDTYLVDNLGDIIVEQENEDTDLVKTSRDYTLGDNLENLTLTGSAINGTGNSLANYLTGNAVNNVLTGLDGNDTIDGLTGIDTMVGGLGDDTYFVDNLGDVVTELAAQGTDLVKSSVNHTLGKDVENLILTGSSAINGTGNELNNTITGNAGANLLTGLDGNDTMIGGDGNDILIGGSGTDNLQGGNGNDTFKYTATSDINSLAESLDGGAGTDILSVATYSYDFSLATLSSVEQILFTGAAGVSLTNAQYQSFTTFTGSSSSNRLTITTAGNVDLTSKTLTSIEEFYGSNGADTFIGTGNADTINGQCGNDSIIAGAGNDSIIGGAGDDTMLGGMGNDTYDVDSLNDVVTESSGQGTDTVKSSVDFTLGNDIENLTLTDTLAINGTGNTLANSLTGNAANNVLTGLAGNDTLNGGAGADTMIGGAGNDTYLVDNAGDVIVEEPPVLGVTGSGGTDLVQSSVTYTISDNIENLTLTGSAAINGTGNNLNNIITGNTGDNLLTGVGGNDTINGGLGADTMIGGAGNDTYVVDNAGDVVMEEPPVPGVTGSGGTDLVQSSVTYTISDNIENLTLTGSAAINGTGNKLNNIITGNTGANVLTGREGNDTLNGGTGNDTLDGGTGNDSLVGGTGNDVYLFSQGAGQDSITDTDSTLGNIDIVRFGADVAKSGVAIFKSGNNLQIGYGSGDMATVQNHFNGTANKVERIEFADGGYYLSDADINHVIQEMTTFATSNGISLTNIDSVKNNQSLMNIVMTHWHV